MIGFKTNANSRLKGGNIRTLAPLGHRHSIKKHRKMACSIYRLVEEEPASVSVAPIKVAVNADGICDTYSEAPSLATMVLSFAYCLGRIAEATSYYKER